MLRIFHERLADNLDAMREAGTFKELRHIEGPMDVEVDLEGIGRVIVMCSNNYLGLANHPDVVKAAHESLDHYGAGTASVRFICGTFTVHRQLEQALAKLHRTEAALSYVSCWNANTGVIPAIAGKGDALISDALNHASLIDACRWSKADRYIYKHADMADLEAKLQEASGAATRLVLTDGVFSMEGDIAPLADLVEVCEKHGAALLVDDSHGTGVVGEHGRGVAEHFGVEDRIDIVTSTLGKALGGAAGGYVASSKALVDHLVQVSRPSLFSNALPTQVAAGALQAVEILQNEPGRVADLHAKVDRFRDALKGLGFNPLDGASAIVPIIVGETAFAIKMSKELLDEGVFVTGFGYPVVHEGTARVRVQICATLTHTLADRALAAFEKVGKRLGVI
jgi:glycine C-acetyltransferase